MKSSATRRPPAKSWSGWWRPGWLTPTGSRKGGLIRSAPRSTKRLGKPADYVRQAGFDSIQQEQMVLQFARNHGRITRKDAVTLCRISEDQARRLLTKLYKESKLRRTGRGPATAYENN